jgi:ABC-type spermidine/putrescine transport system permease subunit I
MADAAAIAPRRAGGGRAGMAWLQRTRREGLQNSALLAVPAVAFLLVFFVLPMLRMLQLSIFDPAFTLEHYAEFVDTPAYASVTANTFLLAFNVALICLVLGYPVAYAINSASPQVRRLVIIPVMLPYLTSLMVRTYAWMVLLGREGLLNQALGAFDIGPLKLMNNSFGVYVGMVHVLLPLMILPLSSAMSNIDRRVVRAAHSLGAPPWMAFVRVFLPLSLPGVVAGTSLVFIVALGFFVTPAILGSLENTTISMVIDQQVGVALNWGFAAALGVVLLLATLVALAGAMLLASLLARLLGLGEIRLLGGRA